MKKRENGKMKRRVTVIILVGLLCLASIAYAQVSENYDLSWNVIGGGGGPMDSASYAMRSTVGKIIGLSSGNNYQLGAGYRYGVPAVPTPTPTKFDTGPGTYPSIFGVHNGTIKSYHDVNIARVGTYPCAGTGGHSEYVKFWNSTWNVTATWKGYAGDWHNITFDVPFVLEQGKIYNYTIRTGSYPQIHHNTTLTVPDGEITCAEFIDANGKKYDDWIPAIRLV